VVDDNSADNHALMIPPFGKSPALSLDMGNIREAQRRVQDAQYVNPVTYTDLEHTFNAAYRDLKRHLSMIGYQITLADKALEEAKADVILDKYPEYMKDRPKSQDNSDMRKAFLIRDEAYAAALDRVNQLKAIESNFDGKIKELENVCRYMRKEMDLILRSGLTGKDLYNTQGRRK
jgi:hypothetical protein